MKTDKLKVGDRVASLEHPHIKSKIKSIKPSHFTNELMYFLENNCVYLRDEIVKI